MGAGGADLVVIGAGCIGGWTAYHAARAETGTVVVLERGLIGGGTSSRAAGIVRAQGGSATSVALGMWSIAFYERQADEIGADSGFRRLGYLLVATSDEAAAHGRQRVADQRTLGLDVTWLDADATLRRHPGLARGVVLGGMMWGPAVGRVAADLALTSHSDVVDTTDLGLDRFDAQGRSRLPADLIALPFPTTT